MRIRDKVDLVGHNVKDILEWARARRPDVVDQLELLKENSGFIFVMSIAYAAGRASVIAEVEGTTVTEVATSRGA